jgi:hypothetical protein
MPRLFSENTSTPCRGLHHNSLKQVSKYNLVDLAQEKPLRIVAKQNSFVTILNGNVFHKLN